MDGSTVLGTVTLNNGVATFPTSGLLAGSHGITAVYSGDNEYNGATSSAVTVSIAQVAATVTGSSSLNPSIYGDSVTLTIKAVGVGVVPSGTVMLTDGASSLGTLTLDSTGQATLTTKALNAGSHTLAITYSGDNNYF
jgi:Bacterial Ig-like domain (group 3)